MSIKDQRNSGHCELVAQWVQRTSGTVGTEDQWNSGYRGPVEQRTRGTVGTEDQRNSENRGTMGTED